MLRLPLKLSQVSGWLCYLAAIYFFATSLANATSILQLTFDDLVQKSELVFEGRVVASDSRWNDTRTEIYTEVTFEISEIIKGGITGDSIVLSFAGGEVGRDNFAVQALIFPKIGETGIYFVERTDIDMMNPLLGWSQGHFVIENDQLMTNQRKKVMGVTQVTPAEKDQFRLSSGEVKGLRTSEVSDSESNSGISADDFKRLIRERLK